MQVCMGIDSRGHAGKTPRYGPLPFMDQRENWRENSCSANHRTGQGLPFRRKPTVLERQARREVLGGGLYTDTLSTI